MEHVLTEHKHEAFIVPGLFLPNAQQIIIEQCADTVTRESGVVSFQGGYESFGKQRTKHSKKRRPEPL